MVAEEGQAATKPHLGVELLLTYPCLRGASTAIATPVLRTSTKYCSLQHSRYSIQTFNPKKKYHSSTNKAASNLIITVI